MTLPYTIAATIHEFTDELATIATDDGQTIQVPKKMISENATVGGTVQLAIFSDQDAAAERERLAKQILNELLLGE